MLLRDLEYELADYAIWAKYGQGLELKMVLSQNKEYVQGQYVVQKR